MKKTCHFLSTILLLCSCSGLRPGDLPEPDAGKIPAPPPADTSNSNTVTLYSNGYVYPYEQSNGYGSISASGLGAWTDSTGFSRVFFYPQQTGRITVALRVKAPENANTLRIRLDSSGTVYNVNIPKSSSYSTIPVGTFNISSARYHCIEIKAATKNGTYLPDVQSVVISGPAAANLKYNTSQYRSAPATHLGYVASGDSIAWFYTEISVPQGADPLYSYYMTNGFNGGYFGIQVNSPTERRVLFSIWSNYDTQDPNQIPAEYAVTLVKKGSGVYSGNFGGEGSGGQSYLKFMWKTTTTYKLLVHAEASGDHTIYTGYFYAPESGTWKLIAQWDKAKTGGKLLGGLYSFVENYSSNGNDYFTANYGNQWIRSKNGTWVELTQARFTTTASPVNHPRYDYGGGANGTWMYMFSGGFRLMNNLAPGAQVQRTSSGTPPAINFNALPNN